MVFEHNYEEFPELTNAQLSEFGFSSPHPQIVEDFDAVVVKVTDGDTITLRTEFRDFDFPLRLLGIDARELNEGGEEARDWLKTKILNADVRIQIDQNNRVGKYGRLLGNVIHNGMSVADEEINLGLAFPFGQKQEGQIPGLFQMFDLRQWLA